MRSLIMTGMAATALFLGGCANKVHEYAPSADNVLLMKEVTSQAISLDTFTDSGRNESSVMCRLSNPVGTPSGETFASYIEKAFKKELVIAGLYNEKAPVRLSLNLDRIYGSTVPGNTYWEFEVTLKSSNGRSMHKTVRYEYGSSLLAASACSEMQRSFVPAVQKLIHEILADPQFKTLLQDS